MDQPNEEPDSAVRAFINALPPEIALMVLESRRFQSADVWMHERIPLEERIRLAGTRQPVISEARKAHENWRPTVFACNSVGPGGGIAAYMFTDYPGDGDVVFKNDQQGGPAFFRSGTYNIRKREHELVINISNASLDCLTKPVMWAALEDDTGYIAPPTVQFIWIDLLTTHRILLDRFEIVDPGNAVRLAKEWTLESLSSVIGALETSNLPSLLLYLALNRSKLLDDLAWEGIVFGDYEEMANTQRMAVMCRRMLRDIVDGIKQLQDNRNYDPYANVQLIRGEAY